MKAISSMIVLCPWLAMGCGAAPITPTEVIELDPMHLKTVEVEGELRVEVLDAEALFREASTAFREKRYDDAARQFALVVETFPESRWGNVSRFNGGLSLERSGHHEEAIPLYEDLARRTAGSKDAHDALFRILNCRQELEQWSEMVATADRILVPEWDGMIAVDRLEGLTRRGRARQKLGDLARSERDYLAALVLYRGHIDDPVLVTNRYVSMAQYQIGEIYRELFSAIQFRLPLERMARDLEDKSNLFLKAQSAYLRAVRHHHPDFAVTAGFRLGALFETLYDDMMAAEIPSDLTREEIEVYFEELRKRVRPLIVKAIDIYERNIRLGRRLGQQGAWLQKTEGSLARLKEVLREDTAREALSDVE